MIRTPFLHTNPWEPTRALTRGPTKELTRS